MFRSPKYPTSPAEAERWVARQRHGTLIATPPSGHPQISILPFVKSGDEIEIHMVQLDPAFEAMCANPRVTFLVSDFLAFTPHHWVDPEDGGRATLNFRAVAFECDAKVSTDPADVAGALSRLLASYEPGASYEALRDGEFYGPRLRRLATAKLTVVRVDAKFKVGPAAPAEVKRRVAAGLRSRRWPGDERAAEEIEASLR
jgi:predicted FMN-binding regulatory protein PaiB